MRKTDGKKSKNERNRQRDKQRWRKTEGKVTQGETQ